MPKPSKPAESIAVMVLFGSPKHNCAGQGICRVDGGLMSTDTLALRPCQAATAIADPVAGRHLRLHFAKASMCPQAQRNHFGGTAFQVNELAPVRIPQWGLPEAHIQLGQYPVSESERYYTVCFELG